MTGPIHVHWFSRQGLLLHLTVVVVVGGCLTATWWQTGRALGGNGLSWAYAFEWPFFAAFAVVMWWKLLHETAASPVDGGDPPEQPVGQPTGALAAAAAVEVLRAARQGDWHP